MGSYTIIDLLKRIPEERRKIIYVSDCDPKRIDPVNRSYHSLVSGKSNASNFTINIQEYLGDRPKRNSEKEELGIEDEEALFDDETDEFWQELGQDRNVEIDLSRPSYEWDRHIIFLKLDIEEYHGEAEYLSGDLFLSSNYRSMYPQNRYRYLDWLIDITKPIERSYVSLYLECLERRGVDNGLDSVLDDLKLLHGCCENSNIRRDIEGVITNLCVIHDTTELLPGLYRDRLLTALTAPILLGYYKSETELTKELILLLMRKLKFKLTAIKDNEQLFLTCLEEELVELYGSNTFPIHKYSLSVCPVGSVRLHNYNLSEEIGIKTFPEIWYAPNIVGEIEKVYTTVYEVFKERKKQLRKRL